jgi:2-haloacid dehalogenase/putative hydrolase of the HAD superfamily
MPTGTGWNKATMSRRRYDAVFIDFYGTITAGDRQAVEETCAVVVRDLGLSMQPATLAETWGRRFFAALDAAHDGSFRNLYELECETLVETVGPLAGAFDPRPFVSRLKNYWAAPSLHPDSRAALDAVDAPLCCVSNADTEDVRAAVALHDLPLPHIVTSEQARSYKPHAGIFERALKQVDAPPERVIHVGDSLHSDVAGAQALGITAVWVCREGRIFDVGEARPDHKISSLTELGSLLR